MSSDDLWYKNAVIYCMDVEKYMDANGDGVGDFEGLSRRLDYLAGLGITCVWLPAKACEHELTLAPCEFRWFRVGSADNAIDRETP